MGSSISIVLILLLRAGSDDRGTEVKTLVSSISNCAAGSAHACPLSYWHVMNSFTVARHHDTWWCLGFLHVLTWCCVEQSDERADGCTQPYSSHYRESEIVVRRFREAPKSWVPDSLWYEVGDVVDRRVEGEPSVRAFSSTNQEAAVTYPRSMS